MSLEVEVQKQGTGGIEAEGEMVWIQFLSRQSTIPALLCLVVVWYLI